MRQRPLDSGGLRGAYDLRDLQVDKVGVACPVCGLARRYDRLALMARVGDDHDLPSLLRKLAAAEGCKAAMSPADGAGREPCHLVYTPDSRFG